MSGTKNTTAIRSPYYEDFLETCHNRVKIHCLINTLNTTPTQLPKRVLQLGFDKFGSGFEQVDIKYEVETDPILSQRAKRPAYKCPIPYHFRVLLLSRKKERMNLNYNTYLYDETNSEAE